MVEGARQMRKAGKQRSRGRPFCSVFRSKVSAFSTFPWDRVERADALELKEDRDIKESCA